MLQLKYEDFLDNIKRILNNNLNVFIYEIRNFIEAELIAKYIVKLTINEMKKDYLKDNKIMEIAINELLINAIEHGMLGIDYFLKNELLKNNTWEKYIAEKISNLPKDKCVKIFFKKTDLANVLSIEVLDGGKGFDLELLKNEEKKLLSMQRNGRGVMLIELGLPNLKYNDLGNEARFCITCNI